MTKPSTGTLVCALVLLLATAAAALADSLVRAQRGIQVQPKAALKAWAFELDRVRLLDGPFKQAMELDLKYLLDLDPDRLLSRFRKFSGLQPKAPEYAGWESDTISGHTLGHYLSALSLMYASTADRRLLDRVAYVVDELALAQQAKGTGFVGGFPDADRLWKEIAAGQIKAQPFNLNGIWVPWYTTHKLMAGLRDAYLLCGNRRARDVLLRLSDWTVGLIDQLTEEQMQQMLATEHGGMLESAADVYALTGDPRYLKLAWRFYHRAILDPLAEQKDILTGLHGNTQIPKVIGAARLYALTGEERLKTLARFFWDKVVYERSFVNGGHGENERFFAPDRFRGNLTGRTAETCNTYNMLKLTRHLFAWEPSAAVADFYERALYNHILASQHKQTGMMIYLCSLRPGHFKVFNTPYDSFWCCTGTGMENHAKYGDSIYFHDDEGLYVNLFIASELDWREKGLKIRQQTAYPEQPLTRFRFEAERPVSAVVRIRHPWWAEGSLKLSVNGRSVRAASKPGEYASVSREWKTGDVLEVAFPMRMRLETLPGDPNRVAILYGPVVLAGALGNEAMDPPIPFAKGQLDYDGLPAADVPVIVAPEPNPEKWLRRVPGRFRFVAARAGLFQHLEAPEAPAPELVPFYDLWDQRYTVYWHYFTPEAWKKTRAEFEQDRQRMRGWGERLTDAFHPGRIRHEREHNFRGQRSSAEELGLRRYRQAAPGGWFSFEMKVHPREPMELICRYWGDHAGRSFDILVDDVKVASQTLERQKPGEFFEVTYSIPASLTQGKEKITVKFQAQPKQGAGPLFQAWMLRRAS
ncbi:MAG: glycoside hydrolase family 127 protein [Bryobacterales bacterium]|nr:glycoside hydrolase family 127 protein [Bryobacteraceae bacterium]MDW8352950.1 glycoside hydrolase family 127 protein [Bryobacterales bacterium]